MIPDKDTLTIYKDNSGFVLNVLSDEQAGQLFKAVLRYGNNGDKTEFKTDPLLKELFRVYTDGIDRIDERYAKRCEVLRANGRKGGRPPIKAKENQKKPKETKRFFDESKEEPNKTLPVPEPEPVPELVPNPEPENNIPVIFDKVLAIYPFKDSNSKERVCREFISRIREGWEPEQLLKAAEHYKAQCDQEETEKKYIIRPWNFYGDKKPFIDYIEINEGNNNADENRGLYAVRDNFFG